MNTEQWKQQPWEKRIEAIRSERCQCVDGHACLRCIALDALADRDANEQAEYNRLWCLVREALGEPA